MTETWVSNGKYIDSRSTAPIVHFIHDIFLIWHSCRFPSICDWVHYLTFCWERRKQTPSRQEVGW